MGREHLQMLGDRTEGDHLGLVNFKLFFLDFIKCLLPLTNDQCHPGISKNDI